MRIGEGKRMCKKRYHLVAISMKSTTDIIPVKAFITVQPWVKKRVTIVGSYDISIIFSSLYKKSFKLITKQIHLKSVL